MNPQDIAGRVANFTGGQESLTLKSRSSANGVDGYTFVNLPQVRRRPLSRDDVLTLGAAIGESWHKFKLFNPPTLPKIGDKVTDSVAITYEVRKTDGRSVHGIYNIVCLQDK